MSEKGSSIPVVERNDAGWMTIDHLELNQRYSIGERELDVEVQHNGVWERLKAEVFRVNHHNLGRYIPSKALLINGQVVLTFYVHNALANSLSNAGMAFSDGIFYAWAVPWQVGTRIRYPAMSRVYIDQLIDTHTGKVSNLFICDPSTYESLLTVKENHSEEVSSIRHIYEKAIKPGGGSFV